MLCKGTGIFLQARVCTSVFRTMPVSQHAPKIKVKRKVPRDVLYTMSLLTSLKVDKQTKGSRNFYSKENELRAQWWSAYIA